MPGPYEPWGASCGIGRDLGEREWQTRCRVEHAGAVGTEESARGVGEPESAIECGRNAQPLSPFAPYDSLPRMKRSVELHNAARGVEDHGTIWRRRRAPAVEPEQDGRFRRWRGIGQEQLRCATEGHVPHPIDHVLDGRWGGLGPRTRRSHLDAAGVGSRNRHHGRDRRRAGQRGGDDGCPHPRVHHRAALIEAIWMACAPPAANTLPLTLTRCSAKGLSLAFCASPGMAFDAGM